MKKSVGKILATTMAMTAIFGATSCKKDVPDTEQTLEIYITKAGYGVEWLESTLAEFQKQDWVKEKYPNLVVPELNMNSTSGYGTSKITAGPETNSIDLFFLCSAAGTTYKTKIDGKPVYEDLSESVYNSVVPGENIKVKEKMKSDVYEAQEVDLLEGGTAYYGVPWVNGMMGLICNETRFKQYMGEDAVLPRTTDELIADCVKIKALMGDSDGPMLVPSGLRYFNATCSTWWAQYEGTQKISNFWHGVNDDGEYSSENFAQTGRLRALEVSEQLLLRTNGYVHPEITSMAFGKMQTRFFYGQAGVFLANGDWLWNETGGAPEGQTLRIMKTPVISSITEKLTSVKDDKALAYVVQLADENKSYEAAKEAYASAKDSFTSASQNELTEKDYKKIYEARNMVQRMTAHEAFIPSYANGKQVAIDFLRFLATDQALAIYEKASNGLVSPYNYMLPDDIYAEIPQMMKDRHDTISQAVILPSESSYRLYYYGGLQPYTKTVSLETAFIAQSASDRKTAKQVFDEDIQFYDKGQFDMLLKKAGLL